ncbi:orotidine-5'-phosphate decarboxylase [Shouchella miscanthi]|uniref:Orotidine 5'-phosphate decarboxylase n=1 Tax=Shouchella miscanthi TaxID=2598861 RepID=A0ABU6NRP8_9BACI|nr:orotidine-5'-phosphate decarboxylase [Shouchella miscanthi]MED4129452.1 orotidine-5'-phosphate decarboxylase [Shouchella miscanthi]
MNFSDLVCEKVNEKKSHIVVGLDPMINRLPRVILDEVANDFGKNVSGASEAILTFNKLIIDTIKDHVSAVKLQIAYFEIYGATGIKVFWQTVRYAKDNGLIVIADAKRGDIDSTAEAYAKAYLGTTDEWTHNESVDAMTINPLMGSDSIDPFINNASEGTKGVFTLVKTSNQSSKEILDLKINKKQSLADYLAEMVNDYADSERNIGKEGYSSFGAVIGATHPEELSKFRKMMKKSIFLVPGYGVQGGKGEDIVEAFNDDGLGALISASRSIIYSFNETDNYKNISLNLERSVINMNYDINNSLKINRKLHFC